MRRITKNGFLRKTIIAVLIMLCTNFIIPTYSHADFGGVLMDPIVDFLCSIGDAIIYVVDWAMNSGNESDHPTLGDGGFLVSDSKFWNNSKYSNYQGGTGGETIDPDTQFSKGWLGLDNSYYIPVTTYSPEQIFANKVPALDVNFINPNKYYDKFTNQELKAKDISGNTKTDEDGNEISASSAAQLQPTIAGWYVALRNLSVVGLLSVLVYIGIRIVLSSTASDKAKYKQMLKDWLVALCILFFMHYIMSFTLTMVESICGAIGDGESSVVINTPDGTFKTNLLGAARFKTQYKDFGEKMTYLFVYTALIVYTLIFSWFYLKRLLMMAFLTLIAPLVALTYPIDKISDGKAQAFESWLKEYIFNALIQPFHLIIYMVFVGTAMDLAQTNVLYMIAALGFILPAEKILRGFFGFNKAGATLGALRTLGLASMANKLTGGGSKGPKKAPSGGSVPSGEKPVRFEKGHDIGQIGPAVDGPKTSGIGGGPYRGNTRSGIGAGNNRTLGSGADFGADSVLAAEAMTPEARRMDEIEQEDYNFTSNPEWMKLNEIKQQQDAQRAKQEEQARQEKLQQSGQAKMAQQEQAQSGKKKNSAIKNWARYHNINPRSIARAAGRGAWKGGKRVIGGVAKGAIKHGARFVMGAAVGALAYATSGEMDKALAAGVAAANIGERMSKPIITAGSAVGRTLSGAAEAGYRGISAKNGHRKDAMLGGTKFGRELDIAHGDSRYADAGALRTFKTNQDNLQYLKDQMTAQGWTDSNGVEYEKGSVPSDKDVRERMDTFDTYISEGMTDVKSIMKAQKAEDYIAGDDDTRAKQAALIASIGKERGITADVLNDDKKTAAQQRNLEQAFLNKGYSDEAAQKQAEYTMDMLKIQNGVANNRHKIAREQKPGSMKHPEPKNLNPSSGTKQEYKADKSKSPKMGNGVKNQTFGTRQDPLSTGNNLGDGSSNGGPKTPPSGARRGRPRKNI